MAAVSRRSFASTMGSCLALCAAPALGRAKTRSQENPSISLDSFVRIMARNDGGVAIRWNKGVLSGIVGSDARQLMGVSQQIFSRHVRQPDGSFEAAYLEIVYFSDLETGEVMETWDNPYTGRKASVPLQVLGPTQFRLYPSLDVINPPFALEGLKHRHWLEPTQSVGDSVMFNERLESFVPAMQKNSAPLKFHEVFSFRGSRAALEQSNAAHVPATVDKFNIISWRPWMEMGRRDGTTVSRGAGQVVADYGKLPSDLIENNKHFHSDVIADIADLLKV